jgi:hypothetical protein
LHVVKLPLVVNAAEASVGVTVTKKESVKNTCAVTAKPLVSYTAEADPLAGQ